MNNDLEKTEHADNQAATAKSNQNQKISESKPVYDFENLRPSKQQFHAPLTVVKERRKIVMDLLLGGTSTADIQDQISEQYGISPLTVSEDITLAYKALRVEHGQELQVLVDKHLGMYYKNYELAKSLGDVRAANQALQYIEKLRGLHKENGSGVQINIQQNTVKLDNLSVEELLNIVHGAQANNLNKNSVDGENVINIPNTESES